MKIASVAFAVIAGALPCIAQAAPRVTTTLSPAELSALETVRKDVWVHWFTGDTAALHRVLGPELVAMSASSPHWQSLQESLAGSADFKAKGGKFISVTFDSAMTHRFGETVVMFAHYALTIESGGKRTTQTGRATEVFVRVNGRWVHTSWHLDHSA